MNYSEMGTDQLSNEIVVKEKELRVAQESLSVVETQDLEYSKQIAEIALKRKNLAVGIVQAKHNVKKIHSELRELERLFWTSKGR